ncbi:hypothetical protein K7432_010692 [Basidiobolus ranarum]|uniref:O-methyltransferase n=1 Tax=Basidiobolus ranarum TaxID=34480 RepID=A0ABR2WND3_9FUNG
MSPTSNSEERTFATLTQKFDALTTQATRLAEDIEGLGVCDDLDGNSPDQSLLPLEAWKAAQRLSSALDRLQTRIVPPATYLSQLTGAFVESKAIYALCKYGVADALQDGPLHLNELAQKVNARPEILDTLLRTIIRAGLFKETEVGSKIYANNRISDFLRANHPRSQLPWVGYWSGTNYNVFTKFDLALDPNQQRTAFREYYNTDDCIYEFLEKPENLHMVKELAEGLASLSQLTNTGLVEDYDWTRHNGKTVTDVGGGVGQFIRFLLHNRPELRGQLFDRETVINQAKQIWDANYPELLERITFHCGDFQKSVCPGADVYFVRWVVADWADSEVIQLLKNIRAVIPPNGTLLISEIILPQNAELSDRLAAQVTLFLRVFNGDKERSQEELSNLLECSGFKVRKVWQIRAIMSIVEAVPV